MESVSRSSFWSFNPEFQFNGAEAALVFPCLNVSYWFCTVPVPAAWTQVTKPGNSGSAAATPTVGNSKDEEPFPSSLTSGRKSLQGSLQLPQRLLLLHPPEGVARHGRSREAPENSPAQHTESVLCVSVTQLRMGFVLVIVQQPQNCLMFSFYSRSSCPQTTVTWQFQKKEPVFSSI